jgi:hypothetical protein
MEHKLKNNHTILLLVLLLLTGFQSLSQSLSTIAISGKAYNENYKKRNFYTSDYDSLISKSEAFSGLAKVEKINKKAQSPPYYSYSKTEFWPKGSWGRNYEDNSDLSECNPGDLSGEGKAESQNDNYSFFKGNLACHPSIRDASFFLQGHIHIYLSGHQYQSEQNETKIRQGIDYLLAEQVKDKKSAGGYVFWKKRASPKSLDMSENIADDYETSHALAVLSEYYLSKFNYKREEVFAAIEQSEKFMLTRVSWDNTNRKLIHVNNNTRGLGIWGLSLAYKVTKNEKTLHLIQDISRLIITSQSADGQWRTGGDEFTENMIGNGINVTYQHDQKVFYHFMVLRGLVEAFSVFQDNTPIKKDIYESINKAVNHVIETRVFIDAPFIPESDPTFNNLLNKEFRLRYYYKDDKEGLVCPWSVYRDEIEKYMETLSKLSYYSKSSPYYTEQDHLHIKNLTNRMAKGLKSTNQNFIKAIPLYTNYMNAIENNLKILTW